jgi:hypothetical protein
MTDRREDDAEQEQETPEPAKREPRGGRPQVNVERAVAPPPETR